MLSDKKEQIIVNRVRSELNRQPADSITVLPLPWALHLICIQYTPATKLLVRFHPKVFSSFQLDRCPVPQFVCFLNPAEGCTMGWGMHTWRKLDISDSYQRCTWIKKMINCYLVCGTDADIYSIFYDMS